MQLLAYLQSSAFSEWLSLSMLGFPTLIALHSVGMGMVVGLSVMVALRLQGLIAGISGEVVSKLLTVAVWGFSLNLVTGLALFITRGAEYISSAIFLIKMLLVAVSTAILFWLRARLRHAVAEVTLPSDMLSKGLGWVAALTWIGAVIAGRLIAYLSDIYR